MKVGTQQSNHQLEIGTNFLQHHVHHLRSESPIKVLKVVKASSNVEDKDVDEEYLDIFSEINSNNFVVTNIGPAISDHLAEVAKQY